MPRLLRTADYANRPQPKGNATSCGKARLAFRVAAKVRGDSKRYGDVWFKLQFSPMSVSLPARRLFLSPHWAGIACATPSWVTVVLYGFQR